MIGPQNPDERRRFRRILFDAPAGMRLDGVSYPVSLIDVSLKGALVEVSASWQAPSDPGHEAVLYIDLSEGGYRIEMEGRIAHRKGEHIGFQCVHIDMDSITHLRRLVELNLGDPDLLERELAALG